MNYSNYYSVYAAGKIPYDRHASVAINAGISLADVDCPARDALKEIYKHIIKEVKGELISTGSICHNHEHAHECSEHQ